MLAYHTIGITKVSSIPRAPSYRERYALAAIMEDTSTPRINSQYLDNYVGRNVMIVGKVVQLRGDTAIIDADGNVTAHLNRVSLRLHP